jgi:hypothetical protein
MSKPREISAQDARQGEIVLRRPWQRFVFMAGLGGSVLLLFVLSVFASR